MNSFGRQLRISLFGESHGVGVGAVLDGVPPGLPINLDAVQARMDARRPGTGSNVSARKESDVVELLSGVHEGRATGAPLAFLIRNQDSRSRDYDTQARVPRPGHADLTEHWWSRSHNDVRGGGHRSGRLTAPLVAAAALLAPILERAGINVDARLDSVGDVAGEEAVLQAAIDAVRRDQDSIGGTVAWSASGVPAALGDPMMDGISSALGHILFAVPAVKGVSFGEGFDAACMRGSDHNDEYRMDGETVAFASNHAGGILGGRTTGQPLRGHVAFKPASSIPKSQHSVDLQDGIDVDVAVTGRHDPCIAMRGAPVVRACIELVLVDFLLLGVQQGHASHEIVQWD